MGTANKRRSTGGGRFEVLHWWGSGDGGAAFEALLEGFAQRHPDVTADVSASDNLGMEVKSRILQESPPDVWFEWPGKNLAPYLGTNVLASLDRIWSEGGMDRNYLDGPKEVSRFDGTYRAVPTDIHRINNLFYSVDLVESAGVDPAGVGGPREFLEVLDQVEAETGVTGLVQPMKNPWTVLQLWATVLLGEHGLDTYEAVADGRASANRRAIGDALDIVSAYADYATDDALFVEMTAANDRFVDGESAFFYQGDWAAAVYDERAGFDYGADWDHVPFPGTDGLYAMNMDACMAAQGALERDAVAKFVEYCGSADAQRRFNTLKGSIPPRTDVSMEEFTPFLQDQQRAFERSRAQPPSVAHGLAVRPEQLIELKTAISEFVSTFDVETATDAMVETLDE